LSPESVSELNIIRKNPQSGAQRYLFGQAGLQRLRMYREIFKTVAKLTHRM